MSLRSRKIKTHFEAYATLRTLHDTLGLDISQSVAKNVYDHLCQHESTLPCNSVAYQEALQALKCFHEDDFNDPTKCFEDWRTALEKVQIIIDQIPPCNS